MLSRSKTWALLLLVATFAAGAVVGVGGRALWVRSAYGGALERSRGIDRLMAELDDELRMAPAQRDSVHAILQRHVARMTALWDTIRPRFDSMRAGLDSEIVRQLSPEQQVRYRDHMARHRHQREKADSGGPKR
jgi:hypothetical protein